MRAHERRPVLVTGAAGTLGQAVARIFAQRGVPVRPASRAELDITDEAAVEATLARTEPWLVVNAAGYARVDDAEDDVVRCHRSNADGAALLARACARHRVGFITFSTDLVFDGTQRAPYREADAPRPLGVYARSKAIAEERVLDAHADALVIRTGALFSPWDDTSFVSWAARTLAAGRSVAAANDVTVSPTYVPDLVDATLDLGLSQARGIRHVANAGALTWFELGKAAARMAGVAADRVVPVPRVALAWRAPRPAYSALASIHGDALPPIDDALARYAQNRPVANAAAPPLVGTTAMTGRVAR